MLLHNISTEGGGILPISLAGNTKGKGIRYFVMATKWLNTI
jgi:hypothetical protein